MTALVNEITTSIQTLSRIERELHLANTRIQEQRETISHHQEQLTQLRETGSDMEAKIASIYKELSEHQQKIATYNATLMETKGRIDIIENDVNQRKAESDVKQRQLEEKQRELGQRNAEKDQEVTRYKEDFSKAKKQSNRVKKDNPVANYLLTEGLEPPELDILAVLIHKKEVLITDLKRTAKTPPAITTRVLKEMENKGILEITSDDKARLAISIE
jgi:peptidoglycan hydrolase CwlO-like protein